jgi:hypothetical protein
VQVSLLMRPWPRSLRMVLPRPQSVLNQPLNLIR